MTAAALLFAVPDQSPLLAQAACQPAYDQAIAAIEEHADGSIQKRLTQKIVRAWHVYRFGKGKDGLKEIAAALKLLDSKQASQMSAAGREAVSAAIVAFRGCLSSGPPPQLTTLTVRTFLLDENLPDSKGAPAGAGTYIRVNGVPIGQTGATGTLTAQVPSGPITVTAIVPSSAIGEATVDLAPGTAGEVSIVLDDNKEVSEDTEIVLAEVVDGVLPSSFTTFTLRFERDDTIVPMARIYQIEVLTRVGDLLVDLAPTFTLTAGAMTATNLTAIRNAIQPLAKDPISIRVTAIDAAGFTHASTVTFRLGQFRLVGVLTPPPSNPSLNVSGIAVRVELLGDTLVYTRTSDAAGRFEITSMPGGNLSFDSETLQGGKYYYGQGTLELTADRSVSLVMVHSADILAGVAPLSSGPVDTFGLQAAAPQNQPNAALAASSFPASVDINVIPDTQNVFVTKAASITVSRGATAISLQYHIVSFEYPTNVLAQSIFNDVWFVRVLHGDDSGKQLFYITRDVNSMINTKPIWMMDQVAGITGWIQTIFDVRTLAADADTTLTLVIGTKNIGDSSRHTAVRATLGPGIGLTINSIEPDKVAGTTGDSSFYSIPRPGDTNHYERWFTLKLTKPDPATISQVRVIIRGSGDLQTVYEEGPGANVQIVDANTIRVRVTHHTAASTVGSTPPPVGRITYRFRVRALISGFTLTDEKASGIRNALWRMPDGFARYGPVSGAREAGLDDWTSRGGYLWLNTHRLKISSINDISGEHSRNLRHATHARGVDIDMYHYYAFGNGLSGGQNYDALATNVFNALNGDTAASARVTDWASASRNGLESLHALNTVSLLIYAEGGAMTRTVSSRTISLPHAWAATILRAGSLTALSGQVLNTGLGPWSLATGAKMRYRQDHNNHIHIGLNSANLAQ